MVYAEKHPGKPSARTREAEIKRWRREKKQDFIDSWMNILTANAPPACRSCRFSRPPRTRRTRVFLLRPGSMTAACEARMG